VRAGLEATGEIPQLDARKGRDGRERRIVQFVPSTPGEEKGLSLSARYLNERDRTAYREGARSLARSLSDTSALDTGGRKFPVFYADPPWRRKGSTGAPFRFVCTPLTFQRSYSALVANACASGHARDVRGKRGPRPSSRARGQPSSPASCSGRSLGNGP
jgi:hypothetical protein